MSKLATLSADDRAFLQVLAEAASTNPFSDVYEQLMVRIAGGGAAAEQPDRIVQQVSAQVRKLEAAGTTNIKQFASDDRELLRHAFLFDVYHRFIESLDKLVSEQVAAGAQSAPVSFAEELLDLLKQRGFLKDEALRYFAIFYQVRRAYYFIDRGLVGHSECMKELRRRLWNNVFTHDIRWYERHLCERLEDFSTMLLGETGCGKGAAAAAIGQSGFIPYDERLGKFAESFTRNFIAINLSQFPETLIESELFGHKKGAFTGAVEVHEGIFARCSPHGSIFLDEIGEVGTPVQIKLLQVLQERTFSPVGSHEKQRFRGRVIAATNRHLEQLRASGQFRDDFYYRLCSDVITVPPLRQRLSEIPGERDALVAQLLQRMIGESVPDLEALVCESLDHSPGKDYPWPGNVRELEQAIRRIVLTRHYAGDHRAVAPDLTSQLQAGLQDGSLDADTLLAGYCRLLYERHGTYEEVARRTKLDRRTVKAYVSKQQNFSRKN